ncbi:hypothetical protein KPSA1_07521 [Pseudomonas syringae pv. actinidiae]|uniref:Uncharacterized protein n=1 Tax=Pseudomonas syringae pv. actinidiae TaxID=103796 RepID=A0A2V0QLN1_PSESF|nr:hypothetical protein KPSA1_07521 [Pseudomonas syringae pv. actinidiae]
MRQMPRFEQDCTPIIRGHAAILQGAARNNSSRTAFFFTTASTSSCIPQEGIPCLPHAPVSVEKSINLFSINAHQHSVLSN